MSRIRKAIVAGLAAAVTAVATGLKTEVPQTDAGWAALAGGAVAAGILAGLATYSVRNGPPPTR